MQSVAQALDESWNKKLEAVKEQRLLKFDSRTLIALGAIVLSIAGYVIQDARNTARQDAETRVYKSAGAAIGADCGSEYRGRIRTEVQLGELREGQNEIKAMIQAHDSASKKNGKK